MKRTTIGSREINHPADTLRRIVAFRPNCMFRASLSIGAPCRKIKTPTSNPMLFSVASQKNSFASKKQPALPCMDTGIEVVEAGG
jgi:hypothetical protein